MRILADTGPLVATVSPKDQYHKLCVETLRNLTAPLLTCWPVIAEAAWLLHKAPLGFEKLLGSFKEGFLEILPVDGAESEAIIQIMNKYASLRPQFADAMLVYLAHRESIDTVFTLDRRDFSVYRTERKKPFHLIP